MNTENEIIVWNENTTLSRLSYINCPEAMQQLKANGFIKDFTVVDGVVTCIELHGLTAISETNNVSIDACVNIKELD